MTNDQRMELLAVLLNDRAKTNTVAMSGDGRALAATVQLAAARRRRVLEALDDMDNSDDTQQYDDSDEELDEDDMAAFDDTDDINDENSEAKRLHRQTLERRQRQGTFLASTGDGYDHAGIAASIGDHLNRSDRIRRGVPTEQDRMWMQQQVAGTTTSPGAPARGFPDVGPGRQPDARTRNDHGLVSLDPAALKHVINRRV